MRKLIYIMVLLISTAKAQTVIDSTTLKIAPSRDGLFYQIPDPGVSADNVTIFQMGGKFYKLLGLTDKNTDKLGIYTNGNNYRARLQGLIDSSYITQIEVAAHFPGSITLNGDSIDFRGKKLVFKGGVNFKGTTKIKNVLIEANKRDFILDTTIVLGENVRFTSGEISVMNFGAGPTRTSIQNMAIITKLNDYAGVYKGQTILFPEGEYLVRRRGTKMIPGKSYTTYKGEGMYKTKLTLDTADYYNFRRIFDLNDGDSSITIKDMGFNMNLKGIYYDSVQVDFEGDPGTPAGDYQCLPIFTYSTDSTKAVFDVRIENIYAENIPGDVVGISKNTNYVHIKNIRFRNYIRQGISLGGGNVRDVWIEDVFDLGSTTVLQVGGHSIHCEPSSIQWNINYLNSTVRDFSYSGVGSGSIIGITTTSNNDLLCNLVSNTEISDNTLNGRLQVSANSRGNIKINNNRELNAGVTFTTVSGASGSPAPSFITGNKKIIGINAPAIQLLNVDSITVADNNVQNTGDATISSGNCRSTIITRNRVKKNGTGNYPGIYTYSTTTSNYGAGMDYIDGNIVESSYRGIVVGNKSAIIGPSNVVTAPTPYELSTAKIFPYRQADGKQFLAYKDAGLPNYGAWAVGDVIKSNPILSGDVASWRCDTAGANYLENWRASAVYYRNVYVRDSTNGRIYYSRASNGQNELPSSDTDTTYWIQAATRAAVFSPVEFYRMKFKGTGAPTFTNNIAHGAEYIRTDGDTCTSKYTYYTGIGWKASGCNVGGGGLSEGQVADQISDSLLQYQGVDTLAYAQEYNNDSLKTRFTTKDGTTEVSTFIPRSSVPVLTSTNFASFTGFQRLSPDGNTVFDIMDVNTGENITATKATTFYGVTITDAMVDSVLVFKKGSSYYIRNFTGPVSAAWYGVKADGTDEWAKLQKAYNATPKNTNLYIKGKVSIGKPLSMVLGKGLIGDAPQLTHIKKHANSTEANIIRLIASGNTISMDSTTEIKNLTLDGNRSFIVNTAIKDTGLYVRNTSPDGDMRIVVDNVNIINTSSAGTYLSGRLGGIKFNKNEFLYNKVGMVVWSTDGTFTGVSVGRSDSIGIANRNANNRWNTISIWGLDQTYGLGWLSTGKRTQVNGMQLQEIKSVAAFINDESSIYNNVFVDRTLDSTNGLAVRFDCRSVTFNGKITDLKAETYRWQSRTRYAVDVDKAVYSTINIEVDELGSRSVYDGWFTAPRDSGTIATVNHIKFGRFTFPAPTVSQVSDSAQIAIGRDTATLRSATVLNSGLLTSKDYKNVVLIERRTNFVDARTIIKLDTAVDYRINGREFYYDPADVTSADDSAMTIVTSGGGRLKQRVERGLNPKWWGAVGNGTTDDSKAFNKMFRWIEGGRKKMYEIALEPTTYLLQDTIFLPKVITGVNSMATLRITGNGTLLKKTSTGVMLWRVPKDITEAQDYIGSYKLILDGVDFIGDNTGQKAIVASSFYTAQLKNCTFTTFDTAVILPFWLNGIIEGNVFTNCKTQAFIGCSLLGYMASGNTSNSAFNANYIYKNRVVNRIGSFAAFTFMASDGCVLDGNISEGQNPRYDMYIDCQAATVANGITIKNTWFESTGSGINTSFFLRQPNILIDGLQNDYADTLFNISSSIANQMVAIKNIQFIPNGTVFNGGPVFNNSTSLIVEDAQDAYLEYFMDTTNWTNHLIATSVKIKKLGEIKSNFAEVIRPNFYTTVSNKQYRVESNIALTDNTYWIGRVGSSNLRPRGIYAGVDGFVAERGSGSIGFSFGDVASRAQGLQSINDSVLNLYSTGSVRIPAGTTTQRPANFARGFRYNTTLSQFEGNNGTSWKRLLFSPFTTSGDIIYWDGTVEARLGLGSTGQILKVSGGFPSWQNEPVYTLAKNSTRDSIILRKDGVQIGAVKDSISSGGTANSNTFTSTLTNTANINSSLFNRATYIKVDNIVNVSMNVQVTPTDSATAVELTFTLPFSTSNTSQSYIGSPSISDNGGAAYLTGEISIITGTTGKLRYVPTTTGTGYINITYQYSTN